MLSVSSCGAARVTSPRLLLIVYSPLKRSEVTATTSIFPLPPTRTILLQAQGGTKSGGGGGERDGDVRLEGELVAAVEVVGSGIRKKKKYIERESSDQTALIRRGGRGGVLL